MLNKEKDRREGRKKQGGRVREEWGRGVLLDTPSQRKIKMCQAEGG